jgi:hypothetical protein
MEAVLINAPVNPVGTTHEVVTIGTYKEPARTLVMPVVHDACWVALEQSVITVLKVTGGTDELVNGVEDGVKGGERVEDEVEDEVDDEVDDEVEDKVEDKVEDGEVENDVEDDDDEDDDDEDDNDEEDDDEVEVVEDGEEDGGFDDDGIEDCVGVGVGQTKLGETPLETVITAVVDASE